LPWDLARVKHIMTMNAKIPKVTTGTTVLEATNLMNEQGTSAVAVIDGDNRVVGFFGERTLLTEFVKLNKKPEEVKVGKIMHMLYRI
jgi:CBS domain-containing protein